MKFVSFARICLNDKEGRSEVEEHGSIEDSVAYEEMEVFVCLFVDL